MGEQAGYASGTRPKHAGCACAGGLCVGDEVVVSTGVRLGEGDCSDMAVRVDLEEGFVAFELGARPLPWVVYRNEWVHVPSNQQPNLFKL